MGVARYGLGRGGDLAGPLAKNPHLYPPPEYRERRKGRPPEKSGTVAGWGLGRRSHGMVYYDQAAAGRNVREVIMQNRHGNALGTGIVFAIVIAIATAIAPLNLPAADPASNAATTQPATQSTSSQDPFMDWLLSRGPVTQPVAAATAPAGTQPSNPFLAELSKEGQNGIITLSDGRRISGFITTTAEQPIRVWDEAAKQYHDLPLMTILTIKAKVIAEGQEQEWNFEKGGSDVKIYTGKSYPTRETQYEVTLTNGQTVTGGIAAPLYIKTAKGSELFILHKTDKGTVGQSLDDLVYVKSVELNVD